MFEPLVILLIVVTVVTVVGHGIWIAIAAIFRAISRALEPAPLKPPARCGFCYQALPGNLPLCPACGKDLRSEPARRLSELAEVEFQVREALLKSDSRNDALSQTLRRLPRQLVELRGRLVAECAQTSSAIAETAVAAELVAEVPTPIPVSHPAVGLPEQPTIPAAPPPVAALRTFTPPPVPATKNQSPVLADIVDTPRVAPPPTAPAPPRKSPIEILAEFMEPHNIRWGEILGGLLFIVGAAALVITQWDTLERLRYVRFAIFGLGTAAVFGVGFYSHYRWKLASTSLGLLTIGTLLVPLNFLAMAGLSHDDPLPLTLTFEGVSLAVLGFLVFHAGTLLAPLRRHWLTVAVMGVSAAVLVLVRRFDAQAALGWQVAAAGLPVLFYGAGLGGPIFDLQRRRRVSPGQALGLFALAGTATFALLVAWGALIAESRQAYGWLPVLTALAGPLTIAAGLAAAGGLTVMRGVRPGASQEPLRVAGLWVALVAATAVLLAVVCAWPHLALFLAVGGLAIAVLVALALRFNVPLLHLAAIVATAIVYLVGYHAAAGHLTAPEAQERLRQLLAALLRADTGTALVALTVALGGVAAGLQHRRQTTPAQVYLLAAAVLGAVSLAIVTIHGWLDPGGAAHQACVVYGIAAAAVMAASFRVPRRELAYAALSLTLATALWLLWHVTATLDPRWATVCGGCGLLYGGAALLLGRPATAAHPLVAIYREPLWHVSEFAAAGGLTLGLALAWIDQGWIFHRGATLWASLFVTAAYALLAWHHRSPERTWIAALAALGGMLVWGVSADPTSARLWQLVLLTHAAVHFAIASGLNWMVTRRLSHGRSTVRRVFVQPLDAIALCGSAAAAALGLWTIWSVDGVAALGWLWLAVLWLLMGIRGRSAALLAAHQGATIVALLIAACTWGQPLTAALHVSLPYVWFYGLAGLAVLWVGVRISLRRWPAATALVNPPWPMPDRLLKYAVVLCHFAVIGWLLFIWAHIEWGGSSEILMLVSGNTPAGAPAGLLDVPGVAAWILLALAGSALFASLWDRWTAADVGGALFWAATLAGLAAAPAIAQQAAGSGVRWAAAAFFLALSTAVWWRTPLAQRLQRLRANIVVGDSGPLVAQTLLVLLGVLPVVAATVLVATQRLAGVHVAPGGGFFARLPLTVSYLVPLAAVLVGLVGHAIRERSAGYAFSAGLVLELTVGLAYALKMGVWGPPQPAGKLVTAAYLLGAAAAVWAWLWLIVRRWLDIWREHAPSTASRVLMVIQLQMAWAGVALPLGAALALIAVFYPHDRSWTIAVGAPLGWITMALASGATLQRGLQGRRLLGPHAVGLVGMAVMGLLACSIERYAPGWGYRALMMGWSSYALLVVVACWWVSGQRRPEAAPHAVDVLRPQLLASLAVVWVRAAGLTAVILALKAAVWHDEPFWGAATIAVASTAGALMAAWLRRPGWAFGAALGVNLAASMIVWHLHLGQMIEQWWIPLIQANALASAAAGMIWLAGHRRIYGPGGNRQPDHWLGMQVGLTVSAQTVLALTMAVWLVAWPAWFQHHAAQFAHGLGWMSLVACGLLSGWYLWRFFPRAGFHAIGETLLGAALLATAATAAATTAPYYGVLIAGLTAACVAIFVLGWLGGRLPQFAVAADVVAAEAATEHAAWRWFRLPAATPGERGLVPSTIVIDWVHTLGLLALAATVWQSFTSLPAAWWLGSLLGLAAVAVALAAWQRHPVYVSLGGMLALGGLGWFLLPAGVAAPLLHRCAMLFIAAVTLLVGETYLLTVPGRSERWLVAGRRVRAGQFELSLALLLLVLILEVAARGFAGPSLLPTVAVAAAGALAVLAGLCVALAVHAHRDPYGLSLRGRTGYVYLAEVLLALIGLHLYLCVPQWFGHHFLERFGMLIALGLAFVGAGLSEYFQRRRVPVLAEPLERTALVLPVVPLLLFWWIGPRTPLVWFAVGLFYGVLAVLRRSVWMAIAGFVAANVGLWVLWTRMDLLFTVHPQLWLIPPALAGLVAEHVSRQRLRPGQSAALRYLLLATIYLSSTADMFIAGLGHSLLLPLVLLALSLAGVLVGMALRIQSFLYLGVAFIVVVLASMLKYLTVDLQQTWVAWTCLLVAGLGLIALFAVFEKRRNTLRAAVQRFQRWQR